MGAPVYNTSFVGPGTRASKQPLASKTGGISDVYSRYKRIEGDARKVAEMGGGLYGAYQAAKQAYPAIRVGMQALGLI